MSSSIITAAGNSRQLNVRRRAPDTETKHPRAAFNLTSRQETL